MDNLERLIDFLTASALEHMDLSSKLKLPAEGTHEDDVLTERVRRFFKELVELYSK